MQMLATTRPRPDAVPRWSTLYGLVAGVILLLGAASIVYLAFGMSLIETLTPAGRPGPGQVVAGLVGWSVALIAPAALGLIGLTRLATTLAALGQKRLTTPAARHARELPDDYVLAAWVTLPDGRRIPELVVGPFGIALLVDIPAWRATRRNGEILEVRASNGRWLPVTNPVIRAARDAESVRRWIDDMDGDFVVKVHAAVVGPTGDELPRSPTCAVIGDRQIAAWLASLPVQRTLTPKRRERLVGLIRRAT